jgi:EAL domain-containing protein (putative c-di-GMP-specific phosphodiesterase class I)
VLKTLRELGVDHAQGYAIMTPQPLTQPPDANRNDDAARAMH